MSSAALSPPSPIVSKLRAATADIHRRLEDKLDLVVQLSDPTRREDIVRRFAWLHAGSEAALRPHLAQVEGLDFVARCRVALFRRSDRPVGAPPFPVPGSRCEALGMLYVLEGSTLGGRMIRRQLAERGIDEPELAFLDPYGTQTGTRWREFLSVLSRETGEDRTAAAQACRGAVRAFSHSEAILCGRDDERLAG